MVSVIKIHGGGVTVVALLLLCAAHFLPSHASTTDEPTTYKHVAPAPWPSSYSPTAAPAPAPVPVPVIIVQGVIYCKSCKLNRYNSDMDASPLPNATAKLVCSYGDERGGYRSLNMTSTAADANGYFLVMVYDVAMFRRSSCRVHLRSSPTALCDAPFFPSSTAVGLALVREEDAKKSQHEVYSATSALIYAPRTGGKCPY